MFRETHPQDFCIDGGQRAHAAQRELRSCIYIRIDWLQSAFATTLPSLSDDFRKNRVSKKPVYLALTQVSKTFLALAVPLGLLGPFKP